MAYRALVCPILEYAAVMWCPYTTKDIKLLEFLQGRAACWICGSHWRPATLSWTVPTDICYSQLALISLLSRCHYLSVCFLHDIYYNHLPPSFSKYCKLDQHGAIIYH